MYPLTHLYVTQQVLNAMNPALALGSILPDILVGAGLRWQEAHDLKEMPDLNPDLVLGDLIHGSFLPGLDYYSDCAYEAKEGYAFQNAIYIYNDLILLGIPKEHALWRGHNFIEMGIETLLNETEGYLWSELEKVLQEDQLKEEIYAVIAKYSLNRQEIVDLILRRFLDIRGNMEYLAQDYANKLNNFYRLDIDFASILELIIKSRQLISTHYQKFLHNCVGLIIQDLKDLETKAEIKIKYNLHHTP